MKSLLHSTALEALLLKKIGFGAYPGGTLARCISRRMQARGIADESAYLSELFSNELEQEELIEEIIVPETWFFRDYEPFVYLRRYIAEKRASRSLQFPLRVLSVPASTGEEPYSIAITLFEAGLEPGQFCVHAVDISRKALKKAGEALYGGSSFREEDKELRRRYFDKTGSMYSVRPEVRAQVRFAHGNVLQEDAFGPPESHDVVFFRNLLIYLDETSRKAAVQNVGRALKEGGLLVLGYAEPQQLFFPGYLPVDHPRSYASIKGGEKGQEGREKATLYPRVQPRTGGVQKKKDIKISSGSSVEKGKTSPAARGQSSGKRENTFLPGERSGVLDRARELADAGMNDAAEELACECLKTDAACVEAHYLLAMTALARGDEEQAVVRLNRVVYLDPGHNDALLHLSLLMDGRGRKDLAARYRRRMATAGNHSNGGER